jgi:hypothetical protein
MAGFQVATEALTPEVKGKFRKCYEAPSAAKLAQIALRWMEGD